MFFTFEGIDGTGKTTQAELFAEYLRERNVDVLETREPGQQIINEYNDVLVNMREMCFRKENNPMTTMLSFFLDRSIHHHEVIDPAVKNGKVVVSDRGLASTFAYQIYGKGVSFATFSNLVRDTVTRMPNMTFWIDLNTNEAERRIGVQNDHPWNFSHNAFYNRVVEGYNNLYKKQTITDDNVPFPVTKVPADGSANIVHERVISALHKQRDSVKALRCRGYTE